MPTITQREREKIIMFAYVYCFNLRMENSSRRSRTLLSNWSYLSLYTAAFISTAGFSATSITLS